MEVSSGGTEVMIDDCKVISLGNLMKNDQKSSSLMLFVVVVVVA